MIEYNSHTNVDIPGGGEVNPLVSTLFDKKKTSVNLFICCGFFPLNDFETMFPIQTHKRPHLTFPKIKSRSKQYHHVFKLCRD